MKLVKQGSAVKNTCGTFRFISPKDADIQLARAGNVLVTLSNGKQVLYAPSASMDITDMERLEGHCREQIALMSDADIDEIAVNDGGRVFGFSC